MRNDNSNIWAVFAHLGTFSKYIFPFGNFIVPLIIWLSHPKDTFISNHGKSALNFQISWFLYALVLATFGLGIAVFIGLQYIDVNQLMVAEDYWLEHNQNWIFSTGVLAFIFICLFISLIFTLLDIIFVIKAAIASGNGKLYRYPLSIPFFKTEEKTQ